MNDWSKTSNVRTAQNENGYAQYCAYRLPCNICRLLRSPCPIAEQTIEVTCTTAAMEQQMRTIDADRAIEAVEKLKSEYRVPHTDSNGERIHFYEMVLIGSEVKGVFDGIIQALKSIAEVGE